MGAPTFKEKPWIDNARGRAVAGDAGGADALKPRRLNPS
jgi:hypothetical protein